MSQICDDIGLIEVIDRGIPPDPNQKLSHGEYVKRMVINGLGFSSRPLYLEVQFFSSKKEIGAEYEIYKNPSEKRFFCYLRVDLLHRKWVSCD